LKNRTSEDICGQQLIGSASASIDGQLAADRNLPEKAPLFIRSGACDRISVAVSLVVSAWISRLGAVYAAAAPAHETILATVNSAISFLIVAGLFAAIRPRTLLSLGRSRLTKGVLRPCYPEEALLMGKLGRLFSSAILPVLALLVCAAAPSRAESHFIVPVIPNPPSGTSILFGDCDGDRHTDFVVARPEGFGSESGLYRIEVHLSRGPASAFAVASVGFDSLHIAVMDVDGDVDLDLVISTELGRQHVGVLINNGAGVFSPGDAVAYPASIWERAGRSWETPSKPQGHTPAFPSASSWIVTRDKARARFASVSLSLRVGPSEPVRALAFCSNPFRAPPLV
jgi:hypothetical protein